MIECTLDVLKNMDQYSDDTEFFAYKVSRKDGTSFLYADSSIFEYRKHNIWSIYTKRNTDDEEKNFIPLTHAVGIKFEVLLANTDVSQSCGPGVNVGTLSFVKNFLPEYKHKNYKDINGPYSLGHDGKEYFITLWKVKFTKKDIACIPNEESWGDQSKQPAEKFRLFRCEVIEELPPTLLLTKPYEVIDDPIATV